MSGMLAPTGIKHSKVGINLNCRDPLIAPVVTTEAAAKNAAGFPDKNEEPYNWD